MSSYCKVKRKLTGVDFLTTIFSSARLNSHFSHNGIQTLLFCLNVLSLLVSQRRSSKRLKGFLKAIFAYLLVANKLYIIMFLHQTTTVQTVRYLTVWLYIIMFLHQTTTVEHIATLWKSCILSCSYIKPQLLCRELYFVLVVYYHVPTSNHNSTELDLLQPAVVYYHVPTSNHNRRSHSSKKRSVVYYHVPTSNHNLSIKY